MEMSRRQIKLITQTFSLSHSLSTTFSLFASLRYINRGGIRTSDEDSGELTELLTVCIQLANDDHNIDIWFPFLNLPIVELITS